MDTDELEPLKAPTKKKDLDVMSIEALGDYIEDLEAEIARAKDAISHKQGARASADSFFK